MRQQLERACANKELRIDNFVVAAENAKYDVRILRAPHTVRILSKYNVVKVSLSALSTMLGVRMHLCTTFILLLILLLVLSLSCILYALWYNVKGTQQKKYNARLRVFQGSLRAIATWDFAYAIEYWQGTMLAFSLFPSCLQTWLSDLSTMLGVRMHLCTTFILLQTILAVHLALMLSY